MTPSPEQHAPMESVEHQAQTAHQEKHVASPEERLTATIQDAMHASEESRMRLEDLATRHPAGRIRAVRESLGATADVASLLQKREAFLQDLGDAITALHEDEQREPTQEEVQARANYEGDWTALTRARLEHPLGYAKFVTSKLKALPSLRDGASSFLQKPEQLKVYCAQQIRDYDTVLAHVFSATNVVPAHEKNQLATNLGAGAYAEHATVFSDAPLSPRQRNIIEAHEMGHGVRKLIGDETKAVRTVIDLNRVPDGKTMYLASADEITERMAQLKNYFGMGATQRFTATHLAYAREHYVNDTGLDNDMSTLLDAIPDDRTHAFVTLMNTLPI